MRVISQEKATLKLLVLLTYIGDRIDSKCSVCIRCICPVCNVYLYLECPVQRAYAQIHNHAWQLGSLEKSPAPYTRPNSSHRTQGEAKVVSVAFNFQIKEDCNCRIMSLFSH